jgi:hypothetical protein
MDKLFSKFYMLLWHACLAIFLFFYDEKVALIMLYGRVCRNFKRLPGIMQNPNWRRSDAVFEP